jgi:hypothetical protein
MKSTVAQTTAVLTNNSSMSKHVVTSPIKSKHAQPAVTVINSPVKSPHQAESADTAATAEYVNNEHQLTSETTADSSSVIEDPLTSIKLETINEQSSNTQKWSRSHSYDHAIDT